MAMREITCAVLGYGGRGREFAGLSNKPELLSRVVAVAEPDAARRARAMQELGLNESQLYSSAAELLAQPRLADAVINTTQDRMHAETSIPAMELGYHLLLEKPMAVSLDDCEAIEAAQRRTGVVASVCHSLRYNLVYCEIKKIIDSGQIGRVLSFDQIEGVGNLHFSSSFVRGPWGNEERSTFMLMSKCCHDIDVFDSLFGARCQSVTSYGSLGYFNELNKPEGAPLRCLEGCPAAGTCAYHAGKVYLENEFWRGIVFSGESDDSIVDRLNNGPYGKCVFQAGNDVADHQVVAFAYEGGLTGTFTSTAFARGGRRLRLHGTLGWLEAEIEGSEITFENFETGNRQVVEVAQMAGSHGGGDYLVFKNFTEAVRAGNPGAVLTTVQASLQSHKIVYAAERSRREGRTISLI